MARTGYVDQFGFVEATGGWLLIGWAPAVPAPLAGEQAVELAFEQRVLQAKALAIPVERGDLGDRGQGLLLHVPADGSPAGRLLSAQLILEMPDGQEMPVPLVVAPDGEPKDAAAMLDLARRQKPLPGDPRLASRLHAVLRRAPFAGQDTIERFAGTFVLKIDEAISCGSILVLVGWLVGVPGAVRAVRLRTGLRIVPLSLSAIRVSRPDVAERFRDAPFAPVAECGFLLPVTEAPQPGQPAYLEIELRSGETGFLRLPAAHRAGLEAIRSILGHLAPRYNEVPRCFDLVGPALAALNEERLAIVRTCRELAFGSAPAEPVCSVIVPLYGRVDYMETQVALLAQGTFAERHELIYVVDDPRAADAAARLADSLFRRFGVPIQLLLLEENVGFAPACNAGLSFANGQYVCFLNSDVFGLQADWLDALVADLARDPSLGIVGPLLLFEDDTVQHQGMAYEALAEYGGWLFPVHPGKGRRPRPGGGLDRQAAVTGACMVMTRALALDLDGFDESYVIGDFEDSDLCLRARQRGKRCAVDRDVTLYHLERKSQATGADRWRMNLTLYNAWVHQRRWADYLLGGGIAA